MAVGIKKQNKNKVPFSLMSRPLREEFFCGFPKKNLKKKNHIQNFKLYIKKRIVVNSLEKSLKTL